MSCSHQITAIRCCLGKFGSTWEPYCGALVSDFGKARRRGFDDRRDFALEVEEKAGLSGAVAFTGFAFRNTTRPPEDTFLGGTDPRSGAGAGEWPRRDHVKQGPCQRRGVTRTGAEGRCATEAVFSIRACDDTDHDIGAQDALLSQSADHRKECSVTRKEIEKQIAALKKEALECDYTKGDPHKWRETIDNIWQDIERLKFILECMPNKAT